MGHSLSTARCIAALAGTLLAIGCGDGSGKPYFGSTQSAATSPPPISGGTLLALHDGHTAVAADPDRDALFVVDLASKAVRRIALHAGDEPGRLVQDGAGLVHVALRSGGAVVTIDPSSATIVNRRAVCPAPRGIAFDGNRGVLFVACNGGELVTLLPGGGDPLATVTLDRDLRDVVIEDDHLLITRFRSAEVLVVQPDAQQGAIVASRVSPPTFRSFKQNQLFVPTVAWRALPTPGGAFVVHQRSVGQDDNSPGSSVSTGSGGYGAPTGGGGGGGGVSCASGIVQSTLSVLGQGGVAPVGSPFLPSLVLPVDIALSDDGATIAVVAAGNARVLGKTSVVKIDVASYLASSDECFEGTPMATGGQVVAVAFTHSGQLIVQRREPAAVDILDTATVIPLADDSREDTGHAIFHSNSGGDIACASCHPEGGEDGHTWEFVDIGLRRTQSLRGAVMELAPFHWSGDMPNMRQLTDQVFVNRMSGPKLADDQLNALTGYLNNIPVLPKSAPADLAAVARGQSLFIDPSVGCAGCHSGDHLTDLAAIDVGTGGTFIVPSLRGVGARDPFIHTGCALTLKGRFDPSCGGKAHGMTAQLADTQLDDLVAYLDTL